MNDGLNNQSGFQRLQEEVNLALQQKTEAETRSKKFEMQFRQGLREIEDLKEQIEQLQQKNNKDQEEGSEASSFMIFNQSQNQEVRVGELEKEKDFLLEKISFLERSNRELLSYKKALEETIKDICTEDDKEKRIALADLNQVRKRGQPKLEPTILIPSSDQVFQSPDKVDKPQ